eukprot:5787396-Amphidinium_carterae.1
MAGLLRIWGPLVPRVQWDSLPAGHSGKCRTATPKGAAFGQGHSIHQFSKDFEGTLSHLFVCESCGGFAQCRWAKLKLPCQGFPSASGQTVLRRIWRAEHPTRALLDTGWFWNQGPLAVYPDLGEHDIAMRPEDRARPHFCV